MGVTNEGSDTILEHTLGIMSQTFNSTVFIGLLTSVTNGNDQNWVETNYQGYARQPVTFTITGRVASNDAMIIFPANEGATVNIVGIAIFDSLTSGNADYFHSLANVGIFNADDQPSFNAGDLTITVRT